MTIAESSIAQNQITLSDIAANSGSGSSLKSLGADTLNKNFEMFLSLLTTQLKNQNPLEPMDADKFTQQLVQYSGIEQQIQTNQKLTDMIGQLSANSMMSVLGFLGKEVTAGGAVTELKNGQASWTLQNPKEATLTGHISIRNDKNQVVATQDYALNPGDNTFAWNGRDKNGVALPEGNYTISVEAKDATGGVVTIGTLIKGLVNGIDFSGTSPVLFVAGKAINISSITKINMPSGSQN